MILSNLKATSLEDAWFQAVYEILKLGRTYTIEYGSYVGQQRKELDFITINIKYPGTRPLVPIVPDHIPKPATMEYVYEYLPYLMENQPLEENEQYNYGQRINFQMEEIINRYKKNGYASNQECISVCRPEDIYLEDPPCLRSINCRIFPKDALIGKEEQALHFYVMFRSNDAWNGFPVNLAGIRLMQEYMSECIGVSPGEITYTSNGMHLYDHVWDYGRELVGLL